MDNPRLFCLTLILLTIISGCAQNSAYRTDKTSCLYIKTGDCAANAIQQNAPGRDNEFELAFVEFNDQGQLRDRKQMQAVLDHYYKIASDNDVVLMVFAHGWHHFENFSARFPESKVLVRTAREKRVRYLVFISVGGVTRLPYPYWTRQRFGIERVRRRRSGCRVSPRCCSNLRRLSMSRRVWKRVTQNRSIAV